MMCSIECSTVTLEYILQDSSTVEFKAFSNYLQQSYCLENLEFWLATQEYDEDRERCEKMIEVFIKPNSPQEINIPCYMRETIIEYYQQGNYHPTIFGDAAEAVLELMRVNSFVPWSMSSQSNQSSSLFDKWIKNLSRKHFILDDSSKSMLKKLKKSLSGH